MTGQGLSQGVQARAEDKDSVRERRLRDKWGLMKVTGAQGGTKTGGTRGLVRQSP